MDDDLEDTFREFQNQYDNQKSQSKKETKLRRSNSKNKEEPNEIDEPTVSVKDRVQKLSQINKELEDRRKSSKHPEVKFRIKDDSSNKEENKIKHRRKSSSRGKVKNTEKQVTEENLNQQPIFDATISKSTSGIAADESSGPKKKSSRSRKSSRQEDKEPSSVTTQSEEKSQTNRDSILGNEIKILLKQMISSFQSSNSDNRESLQNQTELNIENLLLNHLQLNNLEIDVRKDEETSSTKESNISNYESEIKTLLKQMVSSLESSNSDNDLSTALEETELHLEELLNNTFKFKSEIQETASNVPVQIVENGKQNSSAESSGPKMRSGQKYNDGTVNENLNSNSLSIYNENESKQVFLNSTTEETKNEDPTKKSTNLQDKKRRKSSNLNQDDFSTNSTDSKSQHHKHRRATDKVEEFSDSSKSDKHSSHRKKESRRSPRNSTSSSTDSIIKKKHRKLSYEFDKLESVKSFRDNNRVVEQENLVPNNIAETKNIIPEYAPLTSYKLVLKVIEEYNINKKTLKELQNDMKEEFDEFYSLINNQVGEKNVQIEEKMKEVENSILTSLNQAIMKTEFDEDFIEMENILIEILKSRSEENTWEDSNNFLSMIPEDLSGEFYEQNSTSIVDQGMRLKDKVNLTNSKSKFFNINQEKSKFDGGSSTNVELKLQHDLNQEKFNSTDSSGKNSFNKDELKSLEEFLPILQSDIDPKSEDEFLPILQSDIDPKLEEEFLPILESDIDPKSEEECLFRKLQSDIDSESEDQFIQKLQSKIDPKAEAAFNSIIQSDVDPKFAEKLKSDVDSKSEEEFPERINSEPTEEVEVISNFQVKSFEELSQELRKAVKELNNESYLVISALSDQNQLAILLKSFTTRYNHLLKLLKSAAESENETKSVMALKKFCEYPMEMLNEMKKNSDDNQLNETIQKFTDEIQSIKFNF